MIDIHKLIQVAAITGYPLCLEYPEPLNFAQVGKFNREFSGKRTKCGTVRFLKLECEKSFDPVRYEARLRFDKVEPDMGIADVVDRMAEIDELFPRADIAAALAGYSNAWIGV